MVHLDADCPLSRARTYNVVARHQVNCPSAFAMNEYTTTGIQPTWLQQKPICLMRYSLHELDNHDVTRSFSPFGAILSRSARGDGAFRTLTSIEIPTPAAD